MKKTVNITWHGVDLEIEGEWGGREFNISKVVPTDDDIYPLLYAVLGSVELNDLQNLCAEKAEL